MKKLLLKETKEKTYKITILAMLIAIMTVLVFTPLGMIPVGHISITWVHIPVLLGLMIEGFSAGVILGGAFGILSFLKALIAPNTIFDLYFRNPLISVLPRLILPIFAWAIAAFFKKYTFSQKFKYSLIGFLSSLFHTFAVLSILVLIYGSELKSFAPSGNVFVFIFTTIAIPNGILEAIATALVLPQIVVAISKLKERF